MAPGGTGHRAGARPRRPRRRGGGRRKKLTCRPPDDPGFGRGRAVYDYRCSYCHGHDGRARTEAAAMLDPRPADFTAMPGLDRARVLRAMREGRPGTAMRPFGALMDAEEMELAARFVAGALAGCDGQGARYHTVANGWPDHAARYGAAFGFATGEIALDAPDAILSPAEREGRALFRSACISCHEGRVAAPRPLGLHAPGAPAAAGPWEGGHHDDDYDRPTPHDIAPALADPTPQERAGADLYARACAECHAADGTGLNWIGRFLRPGPPDFTAPGFAAGFDPARFAAATLAPPTDTAMPSFAGVLDADEAAAIAAYVRRAFVRAPPR